MLVYVTNVVWCICPQVHVTDFDTLDFARLDPSVALGFYFRDRGDFQHFCDEAKAKAARKRAAGIAPLFDVEYAPPSYVAAPDWAVDEGDSLGDLNDDGDDEYVLV